MRPLVLGLVVASLALAACGGVGAPASTVVPTPQPTSEAVSAPSATPTPQPTPEPTATPAPTPNWDEVPVAAQDEAPLAKQLATVEAALRDPAIGGKQLAWYGHLEQLIFGRLADYPEWREPVLAALPEAQRAVVARALDAGKELRKLHSGPAPKTLPDWKIVAPPPAETLLGYYREAEAGFGVPWQYLAAIHLVETRMGRIRGLSSAGAQGPMQFMPATWAAYGTGDVNDTRDAIVGAARYLRAAGAPGNMARALWAYNHSDFYVNAIELYAQAMKADANAYRGYHGWQVYYWTEDGPVFLPDGWVKQ